MAQLKRFTLILLILNFTFIAFADEISTEEIINDENLTSFESIETNTEEAKKEIKFDPYFSFYNKNEVFIPVVNDKPTPGGGEDGSIVNSTIFATIGAGTSITDNLYFFFQLSAFPGLSMTKNHPAPKFNYTEIYAGIGATYTPNEYIALTFGLESALGLNHNGVDEKPSVVAGFYTWTNFDLTVAQGFFDLNFYHWCQPMWEQNETKQASLYNQLLYSFNFMFGNFIADHAAANFGLFYDGETKTWGNKGDKHDIRTWNFLGLKYAPLDFFNMSFGYSLLTNKNYSNINQNGMILGMSFTVKKVNMSIKYLPLWNFGSNSVKADHHDFRIRFNVSL